MEIWPANGLYRLLLGAGRGHNAFGVRVAIGAAGIDGERVQRPGERELHRAIRLPEHNVRSSKFAEYDIHCFALLCLRLKWRELSLTQSKAPGAHGLGKFATI